MDPFTLLQKFSENLPVYSAIVSDPYRFTHRCKPLHNSPGTTDSRNILTGLLLSQILHGIRKVWQFCHI